MPKYWGQKKDYDCGPVAILNLLKWLGIKKFLGHKVDGHLVGKALIQLCKCIKNEGTETVNFRCALRTIPGIYAVNIRKDLIPRLRSHLNNGGAVVVAYSWYENNLDVVVVDGENHIVNRKEHIRHYALLIPSKKALYEGINLYKEANINKIKGIPRYLIETEEEAHELEKNIDEVWLIYKQWEE